MNLRSECITLSFHLQKAWQEECEEDDCKDNSTNYRVAPAKLLQPA
jgi:hypothetical protein